MDTAVRQLAARLASPDALSSLRGAAGRALAGDPRNGALLWKLGQLNRALGDFGAAARAYAACAEAMPDHPLARHLERLMRGDPGPLDLPPETLRPVPFLRLTDVLPADALAALWRAVEDGMHRFKAAGLIRNNGVVIDTSFRNTRSFKAGEAIRSLVLPRVTAAMDERDVAGRLGLVHPVSRTEVEMTVTNHLDGGFHKAHRDDGYGAPKRVMTCVFYFFREPKGFEGGELLLHDETAGRRRTDPLAFTRFAPVVNSAVFFPASGLHEVLPITTSAADPLNSRLTVNMFFHRED